MGSQLREALRCLCVEIGWSYAVFWRSIGCKSPMHLVWEDGHVAESRAEVLVNEIMTQQVHLIGEGIIGQAASTGGHHWILTDSIQINGSDAKDLAELNHQLLAGIQTIAIIPVLPHGVLQLGSTQMVMENIWFVKHVKDLFEQLKCSIGARSHDMTSKVLGQNRGLCDALPVLASEKLPEKLDTTAAPDPYAFQPMIQPEFNRNLHSYSQCESKLVGVQGILSNPNVKLTRPGSSHDSASKCHDHTSLLTSDSSSSSVPFPEKHMPMFNMKSWEHAKRIDTGDGVNALENIRSLPGGTRETSRFPYANLPSTEVVQLVDQSSHSENCHGIPVDPFLKQLSINTSGPVTTAGSHKQENGLFKACDLPSTESDINGLCDRTLLSTLQECKLSTSNDFQENQRYHIDTCDANAADVSQIELDIEDDHECKFSHVFPMQSTSGNDLYDILGPGYKMDSFSVTFNDVLVNKDNASVHELAADNSTCTPQLDVCPITHSADDGISGAAMFSLADANQLLDDVVSKINSGGKGNSEDGVSYKTSVTNTCSPPVPFISPCYNLIASSEQMQSMSSSLPSLLGKAEGLGSVSAKHACSLDNKTEDCSQTEGVRKSQISMWVESGQNMGSGSFSGAHSKRIDEIGKPNRKRARPGENPRPRPKDRQMIMDRVKELRELVPNGAKCSIDALLEKTIKHMLFLQSVAKHADNLKNVGEPKFIDKVGGMPLKENFASGATWAYQVGCQSFTCPIIVEDLNPPRQMLVEMLCEQRGFFLEIADLIRGLGLTILKGAMEANKDKIWARFAVEANRDVTRMEIFLSIVRALESMVGCGTVPQGVDNINMPHTTKHQSCIAASSNRLL